MNIFAFNVSEEPWNVEDLLDEDDIADKVPLEKLQLLGRDLTLPWQHQVKWIYQRLHKLSFDLSPIYTSCNFFSLTGQSKELRDILCNPHLRQLLRSIDGADSKYDAMKAAMQEPLFVEFSDRCLKIVENEAQSLTSHESDDDL